MLDGFNEEDLKGLSAAERAIMQAGEPGDPDTAELEALASDDDDGAGAEGADGAGKDKAGAGKEGKDGKDGADGSDETDTDEEDDATDTGVTFTPQTPADADKTREALTTRKNEAFQKLMDGEIEPGEYQKVEKEVSGELEKLLQASITDNVTSTIEQSNKAKAWAAEVDTLVKTAKAEGLDYKGDEKLLTEFNRLVKVFGAEANEAGMSDEGLKASKWALKQAHETMQRRHGKAPAAGAAETGADGKPKPGPRGKADLSGIPPSLGKAPIAADANIADEFAHLEGLTGAALEKAVARMTPEQADRYLG